MKYVRTKDGIWLFGGTHHNGDVIIGKKQEIDFGYCFDKEDIIKQADTVEELCDEFVLVRENVSNERMKFYQCLYSRLSDTDFDRKDNDKVFGAIWTDKGLIYVAQINNEGDLELL